MEETIEILVNTEDVKDWHRGMTGQISIGDLTETTQYEVTCKSKYRLKSGITRIKFTGFLTKRTGGRKAGVTFRSNLFAVESVSGTEVNINPPYE